MSETNIEWSLTLYVGGQSSQSSSAIRNLRSMVDTYMGTRSPEITVCDVLQEPSLARKENILALPTLQRVAPLPTTRIIGDLSDIEKVWAALSSA